MAKEIVAENNIPISLACEAFSISQGCYRYQATLRDEDDAIAQHLLDICQSEDTCNWGFGLCYLHLRNVHGFTWNHKRVYRIYRALELNLRIKPKRRLERQKPDRLAVPAHPNQVWSMDFMSDQLQSGKAIRLLNIVDDYNREGLDITVDYSLPSQRVIRSLEHIIAWRGKPQAIRCDNGPEYISHAFTQWATKHNIRVLYIQPGNPQQNAYVERYNRTVRYDWLARHLFTSVEEVQEKATQWLWHYNNQRPNMALGGITPMQKLEQYYAQAA